MIKYTDAFVVTAEVPDEISLAINISNCPHRCSGCHSPELRTDIGTILTEEELAKLIESNKGVSCVCFMGGDSNPLYIAKMAYFIKGNYPDMKIAWYSGNKSLIPGFEKVLKYFDYIKLGPYDKDKGPIDKRTTNQRMYEYNPTYNDFTIEKGWRDITYKFWNK